MNPEIYSGEKPMDFSFLNTLLRATALPPPEPWLAGTPLSYTYFGHFVARRSRQGARDLPRRPLQPRDRGRRGPDGGRRPRGRRRARRAAARGRRRRRPRALLGAAVRRARGDPRWRGGQAPRLALLLGDVARHPAERDQRVPDLELPLRGPPRPRPRDAVHDGFPRASPPLRDARAVLSGRARRSRASASSASCSPRSRSRTDGRSRRTRALLVFVPLAAFARGPRPGTRRAFGRGSRGRRPSSGARHRGDGVAPRPAVLERVRPAAAQLGPRARALGRPVGLLQRLGLLRRAPRAVRLLGPLAERAAAADGGPRLCSSSRPSPFPSPLLRVSLRPLHVGQAASAGAFTVVAGLVALAAALRGRFRRATGSRRRSSPRDSRSSRAARSSTCGTG